MKLLLDTHIWIWSVLSPDTAIVYGMTLVTVDDKILSSKTVPVLRSL